MTAASRAAVLAALLLAAPAAAEPIAVEVVEVAGDSVYVAPGRAAGIVPGTKIRIRDLEAVVVEVTEKTAVVRTGGAPPVLGATGTADVVPGATAEVKQLARPRPPEAFRGQWADPVLPATRQRPTRVPLGTTRAQGTARVTVIGRAFGAADRDHAAGDVEGRVIAAFDRLAELPLAAELDVAGRWFSGGYDSRTHTPVLVRAAELRYGEAYAPGLALGRLRFAATSVGMLDGGRASMRAGAVELAAFGGLVPDPLSGKPDTGAARFGVELGYDASAAPWQPRVSVAAHGSTWDGSLDERRLSVAASAGHGPVWLDGWADAEAFASDNPWGARSVELTGAGATGQWRRGGLHAGLDLTFLRPERSLRLAAALPPEWLCSLAPGDGGTETCAGGDWWGSATASLGMRTPRWAADAGGTLGRSHGQYRGGDRSGYLRGELVIGPARLIAGMSAAQASFASWTAGELGAAFAPTRTLEIAVTYRPELLDYVASTGPALLHSVTADARVALSAALDVALSAVGTTGADRDALAALATFVWRPTP